MRADDVKRKTSKRPAERRDETVLSQWTVVHCAVDDPRIVCRDVITAPDLKRAKVTAERRFAGSEIIRITPQDGQDADRFPGARFIRGQFRPVSAADEAVLHEICD